MSNRQARAAIAQETLEILNQGFYLNKSQEKISLTHLIDHAKSASILYKPEDFDRVYPSRDDLLGQKPKTESPSFVVSNLTTFQAVREVVNDGKEKVLCLNFASAKNPGGGFLGGSQAQEESLARASALYPCIAQMEEMYNTNKMFGSCLYTDHMIYSPDVPVFRDDADQLLDEPYLTSIITAPAVNAGCIRNNEPHNIKHIPTVMKRRVQQVLSLAALHQYKTIVMGAWGCGVFQNDPADVALYFKECLVDDAVLSKAFTKVIFAVLDRSKEQKFIKPFQNIFGKY